MASIRAEKLSKSYGAVPAVDSIDFEIADGEFVAILGPSGCGKSSTMRMIAGLEEISGGTIFFDGKSVNNVRARDRNVAMSFESYALYSTVSVWENIAFPLVCAGLDRSEVEKRVENIAEKMELSGLLGLKPGVLSSGQSQRVGLARALVRNPTVFLLDEPISHLDTRQRYRMRQFIKSLHQEFKHTMIYVTHDQEEALALADRVIVMSDGQIQQMGTPYEVYARPRNLFVAGFVGEPPMNFLSYVQAGDDESVIIEGQKITLPEALRADARKIGRLGVAAVRPHFLSLGTDSPIQITGRVFITEHLQDQNLVFADVGHTRMCVVAKPSVAPKRGDTVTLSIDPDNLLLYPGNREPGNGT
jgi:multiple sugar transport system ATP-binding protein